MGEWRHTRSSIILGLGTRWKWVISFTSRQFLPRERAPSTHWRLGEPRRRSGCCGKETNLASVGTRTPAVQPVARRYTDWAIPTPVCVIVHKCDIFFKLACFSSLKYNDIAWNCRTEEVTVHSEGTSELFSGMPITRQCMVWAGEAGWKADFLRARDRIAVELLLKVKCSYVT
jgi:hypothetical protein